MFLKDQNCISNNPMPIDCDISRNVDNFHFTCFVGKDFKISGELVF